MAEQCAIGLADVVVPALALGVVGSSLDRDRDHALGVAGQDRHDGAGSGAISVGEKNRSEG